MKSLLTYSALNTFRNCPRKYHLRYVEGLRRPERPEALAFGSVIHSALEAWYRLVGDPARLLKVQDLIEAAFPLRDADPAVRHHWHLARAMFEGYAARYPSEPFEIVEIEKEFTAEIRNPDTGRESQTFVIGGKADGIVRMDGELYLLEHKTASSITSDYLDRLWTDTQIALYSHYLRELGYPIVGVLYNVLLKTRLRQREGETLDEYEQRRAELAAKNKSGRSTAQRREPETDAEFRGRLADWYAASDAFHRERIYLSEDRMALLTEEVWQVTQQYLDAKRRGKWLLNTSHCFSFQRPCEYLPLCQSGFNPNVRDNLFEVAPPHEELTQLTVSAAGDDTF
ncbi:MAG: PD-(D/E)XK nuclease family protein [Phycisphaeraceae bacterium]|nr:PD-(D/E)XK nuclease family protein [Phycisphaeraceae bacterium]